jgi:hypothetical protein
MVADHDVRHRVREVLRAAGAGVGLDDRRLTVRPSDHQDAWMRHRRSVAAHIGRDKQQMDRPFHHCAGSELDIRAVVEKRGVESDERKRFLRCDSREVRRDDIGRGGVRGRQTTHATAVGQRAHPRQRRHVVAVHEYQLGRRRVGETMRVDIDDRC